MPKIGPSNKKDNEITVVETNNLTSDQVTLITKLRQEPSLAAKILLGVDLEWYQAAALEDVWRKRFSIFCWSRQIGKTYLEAVLFALLCVLYPNEDAVFIAPSLRQAMNPFNYVRDFYANHALFRAMVRGKLTKTQIEFKNNSTMKPLPQGDGCCADAALLGSDGIFYIEDAVKYGKAKNAIPSNRLLMGSSGFNQTEYFFYNGHVPIKTIKTKRGYELKASLIHPIQAISNNEIEWIKTPDLKIKDRVIIDRTIRWFPNCNNITYDEAYAIGAMIGDGNYTQEDKLGLANAEKDKEIFDHVNQIIIQITGESMKQSDSVHYALYGKKYRDKFLSFFDLNGYEHLDERAYTKNKRFPPKIFSCSKDSMRGFIQGLFDTDGHVCQGRGKSSMKEVGFTNTSKKLIKELQTVLLMFGIVCSVTSRQREEWNRVYELKITGQDMVLFCEQIGFRLKRKQEELEHIVAESKRNYSLTDQIYHIGDRLLTIVDKYGLPNEIIKDNSGHGVISRIKGRIKKNQGISYDLLEKFLNNYREHKNTKNDPDFIYLQDIFEKHYYYDEIESLEEGTADTYDAYIPNDHTFWSNGFISHNTKILGTHASIIGIDEYATFTKEFIDTVVLPMANRKKNAGSRGNRLSIISTPLSKSNHYYAEFSRYQAEQAKDPNGDYHVSTYTFLDSDNVDMDIIVNQLKSMPFTRFARENLAMFMSNVGGIFPEEVIRNAEDEIEIELTGKEGFTYVLGIDPPSVNNQCGITIDKLTEDNKVAETVFCAGIPAEAIGTPDLLKLVIRLIRRFRIVRMHIDQGGGGLQLAQILFEPQIIIDDFELRDLKIILPEKLPEPTEWKGAKNVDDPIGMMDTNKENLVIKIVPFSPHYKSAMYFNYKNGLQAKTVLLPKTKMIPLYVETNLLKGEMESLKGALTSSSLLHITKPNDSFDDRVDSSVLAYDAYLGLIRGDNIPTKVTGLTHSDVYSQDKIGSFDTMRNLDFPDRGSWRENK